MQLATDANASRAVLGQFAYGGGWYSALYFSNGSLNQVSFTVNFIGDDGKPLSVPLLGGTAASSATITLAPGGSTVLEAPNVGTTVNQGYASVFLPVGVTGYGVFRQSLPGVADQEAVVPLAYPNVSTLTMVYDEVNSITAVAITNPSGVATSVTVTVEDIPGNVIATSTSPLVLQPGEKKEYPSSSHSRTQRNGGQPRDRQIYHSHRERRSSRPPGQGSRTHVDPDRQSAAAIQLSPANRSSKRAECGTGLQPVLANTRWGVIAFNLSALYKEIRS